MTREVVIKTHKGRGKMPRCPTCHRPATPLYLQVKGIKVLSGEYKCVSCQKLADAIIRPPARPYNADIRDFLKTHNEKYDVIYADPPWRFQEASLVSTRSPERHYPTMSGEEIKALPVQNIAERNAILFMWGCRNANGACLRGDEKLGFHSRGADHLGEDKLQWQSQNWSGWQGSLLSRDIANRA